MSSSIKVLVAEDEPATAFVLEHALRKDGYVCTVVGDGAAALKELRKAPYDVLLSDWLMPGLNGIDLIREVRREIRPAPLVVMVTSIDTESGRSVAMMAGADEFIAKPVPLGRLLRVIRQGLQRMTAPKIKRRPTTPPAPLVAKPPHAAVLLAASTGGPTALLTVLRRLGAPPGVAVYVVQHGPEWMLRQLATRIARESGRPAHYIDSARAPTPGEIHLAPADADLKLVRRRNGGVYIELVPPVGPSSPTADPLFESAASVYGAYAAAAVLTGLGADGSHGVAEIHRAGGIVLAQSPGEAVANGMPSSAVATGAVREVEPLDALAPSLARHAERLAKRLGL